MSEDDPVQVSLAWGCLFAWLTAATAQAAPADEAALPGVTSEPTPAPGDDPTIEIPDDVEAPADADPGAEAPDDIEAAETEPATEASDDGADPTEEPELSDTLAPPPVQSLPSRTSPTSSRAPKSRSPPEGSGPEPASPPEDDASEGSEDGADDAATPEDEETLEHKGFIIDMRLGVMGCTGTICKRHGARPGFRIDGLIGRNLLLGFIDLGLAGGWGRMATRVEPGTPGLPLYGLDPAALPPEAQLLMFDQFTVDDAHFESIQAGLNLRVHVLPRGRFDPYLGLGVQYNLFRGRYDTPGGPTRLGFHGLAFPFQGGFVVFANKNFAFGAQFDYLVSWYGAITVRGAPGRFAAPIAAIKDTAAMAGVALPGDLPHLWSVGGVIHIRLGK